MPKKTFTPEQIVGKLRQVEVLIGQGKKVPLACREAGIVEQTFYRWRKEYGGLQIEQALGVEGVRTVHDVVDPVRESGRFGDVEHASFGFVQDLDREGLVDLVVSRSYCAVMTPAERAPVLARVERLFEEHAVGGRVALPYTTECFRALRR